MTARVGMIPLCAGRPGNESPAGWRWFRLTDVARLETGHTPSRNHPEWWGGPIPWISLADIRELDGKIAQDTIEHTNELGIANSAARVLPEGTVVLSRTASVGFVTILGRPMATSQDFVNWVCGPELDAQFFSYLLWASREYIRSLSSGAIHQTVYMPSVESLFVSVPSLSRQKEISRSVNRQLAEVIRMRTAAEARLEAAKALSRALLQFAFRERRSCSWPVRRLGEVCRLLASRSITTDGDTPVVAITTACLTENGFDPAGVKQARMLATDAVESAVFPGEILVARSNTPELVGRAAVFAGEPAGAVASDLTVRIEAGPELLPAFVGAYLSYLYTTGYWRERAGGASCEVS
jgi:restriction endonuclease S subunit